MTANEIIQLLGVLYLVIGVSFLFNRKYYRGLLKDMLKSTVFKFFGGYIALITGFVLLLFFNELSFSKEGLITIIGGMALFKGLALLISPNFFGKFTKVFTEKENFNLMSLTVLVIGLLLIYLGYFG